MRNLLALSAVLVLTFAGVGYWRSWYALEGQPASPGKVAVKVEMDAYKVGSDFIALGQWIMTRGGNGKTESEQTAQVPGRSD